MAGEGLGYKGGILMFEEESVYGTVITRTKAIRLLSDNVNKDQALLETASLNEGFQDEDDTAAGRNAIGGELSSEMRYSASHGTLLKHALGANTSVEIDTFTVGASNNKIDFKEDGAGTEKIGTIASATYDIGATSAVSGSLCEAIKTAMEAGTNSPAGTYTISFNVTSGIVTIAVAGGASTVQVLWKTGTNGADGTDTDVGALIGFSDSADSSDAASIVGGTAVVAAYTHTLKIADSLPTGLTLEVDADIKSKLIEGGKINTITLAADAEGFMTMDLGISGEDLTLDTPTTGITLPTEPLIAFPAIGVTYNASTLLADSFSLQLNSNLNVERYKLNSQNIKEPLRNGKWEVTGTLVIDFTGTAEFDDFIAQTSRALVITATGAVLTGVTTYLLTITMSKIKVTGATPLVSEAGILKQEITFKAFATDTNTRELVIELVNGSASI